LAAGVLALSHDYHAAFAWLLVPAVITLGLVLSIRLRYPEAGRVNLPDSAAGESSQLPVAFWIYSAGAALVAFGFADYTLISFHFTRTGTVGPTWVPILYALGMAADGGGSLVFGRWFDKRGLIVLVPATLGIAIYPLLVFLGGFPAAIAGTILWGFGIGVHEAIMSAAVARMVPAHRRGTAYGLFNSIFGISWFAGSAALGALYDWSITAAVVVAVVVQLAAVAPIWFAARRVTRSVEGV
jgi:predicted MFS family arabinose efflux permease